MEYMLRVLIDDSLPIEDDMQILIQKYNAVELSYDEDSGLVDYRIETDEQVDLEAIADELTSIEVVSIDDASDDEWCERKELWEV